MLRFVAVALIGFLPALSSAEIVNVGNGDYIQFLNSKGEIADSRNEDESLTLKMCQRHEEQNTNCSYHQLPSLKSLRQCLSKMNLQPVNFGLIDDLFADRLHPYQILVNFGFAEKNLRLSNSKWLTDKITSLFEGHQEEICPN